MRIVYTLLVMLLFSFSSLASDTLRIHTDKASLGCKPKVTNFSDVMDAGVYPVSLRKQGVEGEVLVDLWIDDKGELTRYKVAESTNDLLREIVEGRISLLEFEPARDALGKNISSRTRLPFQFTLDID